VGALFHPPARPQAQDNSLRERDGSGVVHEFEKVRVSSRDEALLRKLAAASTAVGANRRVDLRQALSSSIDQEGNGAEAKKSQGETIIAPKTESFSGIGRGGDQNTKPRRAAMPPMNWPAVLVENGRHELLSTQNFTVVRQFFIFPLMSMFDDEPSLWPKLQFVPHDDRF
jgi:hypothetical protein